ncbi:ig-like domain-containing protein [Nephila pilipes]|uniref:Ig-like domain-containing protein n=1 Tax=Nephila pilipes TaxID=299642 RepID=A0A8X6NTC4_NEPPI|nr:ig-like domain-containing protein [Nephila pilipes]
MIASRKVIALSSSAASAECLKTKVIRVKYEIRTYDDFVVKGNTAVLKCYVPSSVQDFVPVISWETDEGFTIQRSSSDSKLIILEISAQHRAISGEFKDYFVPEMDVTLLKTQRKSLRTSFTICAIKIDAELMKEIPDVKQHSILKSQIGDKFTPLETSQRILRFSFGKMMMPKMFTTKISSQLRSIEINIKS